MMEKFIKLLATTVVIDKDNIDTDQLLPKQFLTGISRKGYGQHLFFDWRYIDGNSAHPNPDFILNTPLGKKARVLISGKNFGCGSSREHAPWALSDYGFKVIIAESFADIFYNNCLNNGILPISLDQSQLSNIKNVLEINPESTVFIDLPSQWIVLNDKEKIDFEIEHNAKESLLNGWDKIGKTLSNDNLISLYESAQPKWLC